jgi:hypothetical protein
MKRTLLTIALALSAFTMTQAHVREEEPAPPFLEEVRDHYKQDFSSLNHEDLTVAAQQEATVYAYDARTMLAPMTFHEMHEIAVRSAIRHNLFGRKQTTFVVSYMEVAQALMGL